LAVGTGEFDGAVLYGGNFSEHGTGTVLAVSIAVLSWALSLPWLQRFGVGVGCGSVLRASERGEQADKGQRKE
jgi:hypothetical protein